MSRRSLRRTVPVVLVIVTASLVLLMAAIPIFAELTDVTQTPNAENEGIKKSLEEQIGAGRGDVNTPNSSIFIIQRDPFRAISRGQKLFQRKFTVAQGFGPRINDGIGDIEANPELGAGLVDSCAGCHGRPHGSAGSGGNNFTRPDSRDAPHLFGLGLVEMLADEITSELRAIQARAISEAENDGEPETLDLVSKGIYYGKIRAFPDGTVDTSMMKGVDPDLRIKPFFADGQHFSIRQFAVGAFQTEMGLQPPDPDLLAASMGADVTTPSGMVLSGSTDEVGVPLAHTPAQDPDDDKIKNEIDTALVDFVEFYLLNYFKPATYQETDATARGRKLFEKIGCAECHIPDLPIERDRRVADVETVYDPDHGVLNNLFATAKPLHDTVNDGTEYPPLQMPLMEQFLVKNIFADFKRHDLGPDFHERNFDGSIRTEFMTEPLWGVGTTAPYGHDGRSINLREVILRHGGEAQEARDAFAALNDHKQSDLIQFLESLVLFGPPDTASNLSPGEPDNPTFPVRGHGSIDLSVLFNDPDDKE
jgi:Di-haem oxidoreductase, putative peroxidase